MSRDCLSYYNGASGSRNPERDIDNSVDYQTEPGRGSQSAWGSPTPETPQVTAVGLAKLAPDGNKCLLTKETANIEVCYLVSLAQTPEETVDRLERWWGLESRTLNLHTQRNLIFLQADLHHGFDRNQFALLPEKTVLQEIFLYYQLTLRRSKPLDYRLKWPHEPIVKYTYRVVPTKFTSDGTISRRLWPTATAGAASNGAAHGILPHPDAESSVTPTAVVCSQQSPTFPLVESHIHPFFAICNAAVKKPSKILEGDLAHMFVLTQAIYGLWISGDPPFYNRTEPFDTGPRTESIFEGSDGYSEYSCKTHSLLGHSVQYEVAGATDDGQASETGSGGEGDPKTPVHMLGTKRKHAVAFGSDLSHTSPPYFDSSASAPECGGNSSCDLKPPHWHPLHDWVRCYANSVASGNITSTDLENAQDQDMQEYGKEVARPLQPRLLHKWAMEKKILSDSGEWHRRKLNTRKWASNDWAAFHRCCILTAKVPTPMSEDGNFLD
ncbi:hypothetical protein FRB95_013680 [Tulasnella sp. JGI-2019a]|nr:hypothetical protein FRB95_013680 [Tulasnella sp. JGI-2019a]